MFTILIVLLIFSIISMLFMDPKNPFRMTINNTLCIYIIFTILIFFKINTLVAIISAMTIVFLYVLNSVSSILHKIYSLLLGGEIKHKPSFISKVIAELSKSDISKYIDEDDENNQDDFNIHVSEK